MICKLFPNPNSGVFDLDIRFDKPKEGTIRLLDVIGNKVWSEDFSGTTIKEHIFLADIVASTYFLIIKTGEQEWMKEVVIY